MKTKSISIYFIYLWLILFCLIPLSFVIIASFLSSSQKELVTLPFTLSNYHELFSPLFLKIFFRSILLALITTLCCLAIAYPFSYFLTRSKYQSVLLLLIIIPFWTSSLIRTYSLIAILKFQGVLNVILLRLHIINEPLQWLYNNFAVVSGLIYNLLPFMILPLYTNMERFDFKLIDAAKDLGAKKSTIFFKVYLPNTYPGIVAGCLLVFLPAMTLFYIPNILGGARSILLGNLIQTQFLVLENWPQGAATSVILTMLLILLLLIFKRFSREVLN